MTEFHPAFSPADAGRRRAFEAQRRVQLPSLLAPAAADELARALETTAAWERTLTDGSESVLDVPPADLVALSAEAQIALNRKVYAQARSGFAYVFETIRVSSLLAAGQPVDPAFEAIYRWLNGPAFLGMIADVTGEERGVFVDAQATRYLPGFFLNAHVDEAEGKDRLFAYVLNLSREWKTDWGGLLLFHDETGNVSSGFAPAFNTLNLFTVPQRHSVSLVAPFAGAPRLSITGWIRSRRPDGAA